MSALTQFAGPPLTGASPSERPVAAKLPKGRWRAAGAGYTNVSRVFRAILRAGPLTHIVPHPTPRAATALRRPLSPAALPRLPISLARLTELLQGLYPASPVKLEAAAGKRRK
jgi:hypothetical protein